MGLSGRVLAGHPGHGPTGEVLGRPPRFAERLGRRRGAPAHVAGHHDGPVPGQLVEVLAQLTQGDVDPDRVGPFGHLVGLADVEQEDLLAAGDAVHDLGGLDLGIGHDVTIGVRGAWCPRRYCGEMALPRKFLNEDEELLAEMHPHWIFLFGPLFTSIGVWAGLIVLVVLWSNPPGWTNYPILVIAVVPGLWLLARFIRWKSYDVALTSTRILVRQGIIGRDTIQLRLQRITEVNLRQSLVERVLSTGSLVIDVQGEDDSLTLEYMRKPAVVQRVINSQINEIVGGGRREVVPEDMRPTDAHRPALSGPAGEPPHPESRYDTPPFGLLPVDGPATTVPAASGPSGAPSFEVRDRLIELDDLRKRGILSEEEFAAKKSELLGRI